MVAIAKECLIQLSSEAKPQNFKERSTWSEFELCEEKSSWNAEEKIDIGIVLEVSQHILHQIKLDTTKEEIIKMYISINKKILSGVPVIKGTRIPVYLILGYVSEGCSFSEIREAFPSLENDEQIKAAILFASEMCYSSLE